jgi:hypothetical protein
VIADSLDDLFDKAVDWYFEKNEETKVMYLACGFAGDKLN